MNYIFERHEPASIKKEYFSYIQIDKEKDDFMFVDAQENIKLLNRYLVKKGNIEKYLELLTQSFTLYSCIYLSNKSKILTNVQRLIKIKSLKKAEWIETQSKVGLFFKRYSCSDTLDITFTDDLYTDSIFVALKGITDESEIITILEGLQLFRQPVKLRSYYLTEEAVSFLSERQVVITFLLKNFYEKNVLEEEDIFISYSTMKL